MLGLSERGRGLAHGLLGCCPVWLYSAVAAPAGRLYYLESPLHPPLCGGLFRCCRQQLRGGSRVAAAFPRASRRPGGRRSARRRTIPRRRSAAPSWCRRCPFVGCGFAANARAALPAALVLAGSGCVLGSGFFLFARAGQRQRAKKKKNENLSPAQNLRAKSKKPLCSSIQYVAALAGN